MERYDSLHSGKLQKIEIIKILSVMTATFRWTGNKEAYLYVR